MQQQLEPSDENLLTSNEQDFDAEDFKSLAGFLDVLLEADFILKREQKVSSDD